MPHDGEGSHAWQHQSSAQPLQLAAQLGKTGQPSSETGQAVTCLNEPSRCGSSQRIQSPQADGSLSRARSKEACLNEVSRPWSVDRGRLVSLRQDSDGGGEQYGECGQRASICAGDEGETHDAFSQAAAR